MRIAVFSDIHGNSVGLQAVFAQLKAQAPLNAIYALGDFLAIGPGADDVIELLVEHDVQMIRGNWDEVFRGIDPYLARLPEHLRPTVQLHYEWLTHSLSPAAQQLLAGLPLHAELPLDADRRVFFCHAAPDDPWSNTCSAQTPTDTLQRVYGPVDADLIMYGHYHAHHVLALGGKLLVNVASIGMNPRETSAYTIVEYHDSHYTIQQYQVPYDTAAFRRLCQQRDVPGMSG